MLDITTPSLRQLYEDWLARRRGREFPARTDFDPLELGYVLGNLSLLDVLSEPGRYRYRIHATNTARWFGYDLTGKEIEACSVPERRERIRRQFDEVVRRRAPMVLRPGFTVAGRPLVTHEILVLPLADDGARIDMLMSAVVIPGGQ